MKTKLTALMLVLLTGLDLWAQVPPPGAPATPAPAPGTVPAAPGTTPPAGGTRRPRIPTIAGTNGFTRPIFPTPGGPGTAAPGMPAPGAATTPVQPAKPAVQERIIPAGSINWTSMDVNQVLDAYSKYVNKVVIRPATLPAGTIMLQITVDLTESEVKQAIEAVLAVNGISVVPMGDKFIKVVPTAEANMAGGVLNTNDANSLPDLGSYVTHIEQMHYVKPSLIIPFIQPFAKLQGGLSAIDDNGILVMRDYAENIKRMLEMIAKIDVSVPAEFVQEVIPIRYAEAADIASALSSLGGGSGGTVSFGSSPAQGSISGLRGGTTGMGSMGSGMGGGAYGGGMGGGLGGGGLGGGGLGGGGLGGSRPYGSTTGLGGSSTGTPTGGTSFQQRLQSIINRSGGGGPGGGGGGQDQIQLFGQAKIIADQRSNSLLVFASRADMERIREIIGKLDVLLAQVLIESIIMDVNIGHDRNVGVSAIQHPQQFNNSDVAGGGIMNNGNGNFLNFLRNAATNGVASSLPTNTVGGLSYFTSIGDTWDVAVKAAESDNNASIIQRPRIQTSQAKPAQFFVGQTVPYVTSTYNNAYNGGYGGSSYSQLSVGVELDVTPFINPDGLVVMDIGQEIDEISGYTTIDGNNVPNTVKRTLNTEIAVKNRDTVILGGFVQAGKSHTKSGVPVLMDLPLLGWLFSSREDKKDRTELLVMMRPTVLKTPEIAAAQTIREAQRLPGVAGAAFQNAQDERTLIEAERKKELKAGKNFKGQTNDMEFNGVFNMKVPEYDTNSVAPVTEPSDLDAPAPAGETPAAQPPGTQPPTVAPPAGTPPGAPQQPSAESSAIKQERARAALMEYQKQNPPPTNPPPK